MATDPAIISADPPAGDPPAPPAPPAPPPAPANDPPAPPAPPAAGDPPADPAPPPAGDDWRARLAGDDDKLLGFLGRYTSERAFVEAAKKDRDAVRNKAAVKLPDNPTDEELAAYRKEMGIPDKPEGYLEKLPDGLVVGDDDRPYVDTFLAKMHGTNAPKGAVDAALSAYYEIVEEQAATQSQAANVAKNESIEALREEWGPDYKRNLNAMHAHLDTLPEAVANVFKNGIGPDGLPVGYNAEVLKWLAAQALEANPLATVVPGAGANQASAIADEMKQIEEVMRTDRARYNRDDKMQERYRTLIDANMKLQGKG